MKMKRLSFLIALLFFVSALASAQDSPNVAKHPTKTFAQLGTPANGTAYYCADCQATAPCTSGGTGAVAERVSGAWNCSTGGAGVVPNAAITGATKTKITYDSKGLITAGADIAASDLPSAIDAAKIADGTVSSTKFQFINSLSSNAQTQISAKEAT